MAEEHKFAEKLREKQALADAGDASAAKYLGSQAAQGLRDYLNPDPITGGGGVPESRGGGLGAVLVNDPVLSAGSEAAQLERENLLYSSGNKRRSNLTAADIKGINIPLVRQGLSPDDYFRFNQMLYSPNIEEYEKARPVGSGKAVRDIVTMATPLKYLGMGANWLKDKAVDASSNIMDSSLVEGVTEEWKGRKKGGGWKGALEDTLNMLGIGNTTKTNEFIKSQTDTDNEWIVRKTDTDGEIKTNMEDIKTDKKKTINLHELTDLKAKRNELFTKITQGGNEPGLMSQYEQLTSKILELEQHKTDKKISYDQIKNVNELIDQRDSLWQQIQAGNNSSGLYLQFKAVDNEINNFLFKNSQSLSNMGVGNMKEGGIATLATGGFLEDRHRQPTNPLLQPTNMGGGFGNQFEDITNKLTSMEEGISTLNNRMALPQQGQNPWMLGRYG